MASKPRVPEVTPLVTGTKLSQIAAAGSNYASTDQLIGVRSGTTDILLSFAQVNAGLSLFGTAAQGVVPASGGGTANFLRADGTWAAPAGSGGITGGVAHGVAITNAATTIASNIVLPANNFLLGQASADPIAATPATVTGLLSLFSTTTTAQGVVPGSNGAAATSFLNATGAWSVPAGSGGGLPLIGTGATVTTSQPLLDLSQTWNNSAVAFTAMRLNITGDGTATAANGSALLDLQSAGTSRFKVGADGDLTINGPGNFTATSFAVQFNGVNQLTIGASGGINVFNSGVTPLNIPANSGQPSLEWGGYIDLFQVGTTVPALEIRSNSFPTTAMGFRVFNTWTNSSNYERAAFDWQTVANVLLIGAQNAGTGVARPVGIVSGNRVYNFGVAPATKTTAYTVVDGDQWLTFNGGASITVTLPTASNYTGREITLKTIAAFTVVSASSNVLPIGSATAGTAILPATAGKFVTLVSDGTNWVTVQGN